MGTKSNVQVNYEKRRREPIDKEIQLLIDWSSKYPRAEVSNYKEAAKYLKRQSKNEEEYQELITEYKKMKQYYEYIKQRKSRRIFESRKRKKIKRGKCKRNIWLSKTISRII